MRKRLKMERNRKGFFAHVTQDDDIRESIIMVASIKECTKRKDLHKGSRIHADIVKLGLLEKDIHIGTSIVNMYAKCGALMKAREVFDRLRCRNLVAWNVLISGYAEHGYGQEALSCAKMMRNDGFSPNQVTFLCILKACGSIRAIDKGREIHCEIIKEGVLMKDVLIGTALIDMYVKCGMIQKAQEVFDELPSRNVVSWTALIGGYSQQGHGENAINLFEQMKHEGLSPNPVTLLCILKACTSTGAVDMGEDIHREIVKKGDLLDKNLFIGNALVDMYSKCDAIKKAQEVFDMLIIRDTVSWNALLAGYGKNGQDEEALNGFQHMQQQGVLPDGVTFVFTLKVCGNMGEMMRGQEMHAEIAGEESLRTNAMVGNALVDMYAKCNALTMATEVFDQLPRRSVISWNTLIAAYTQHGDDQEALRLFFRMQDVGFSPDSITYACILKACGNLGVAEKCEEIHAKVVREGILQKHVLLANSLVDMYAKSGALPKAQDVFDEIPVRDTVSWTLLIAGYAEHGCVEEALQCFEEMQHEGLFPNAVTFIYIVKACGDFGMSGKGQLIHDEIVRCGFLERDSVLGTALVNMYSKCGLPEKAQDVFNNLKVRNIVSWNAIISGYVLYGMELVVFNRFNKMLEQGIKPSSATFTILLNTCSHLGLLERGLMYFATMSLVFNITPFVEHYTCIVDLFGRAGDFDKAILAIKHMPFSVDITVWHTLLGACQKWGNVEIGVLAFEHAIQLDRKDSSAYVGLSNLYATSYIQDHNMNGRNSTLCISSCMEEVA